MENASKALIIAGAILISILIIALGVFIYNNAANTVKSADMTEYEMQSFNDKFQKYEGTQTGSSVKALIDTINANNSNSSNPQVKIDTSGTVKSKSDVVTGKTYTVTTSPATGYITTIKIQ